MKCFYCGEPVDFLNATVDHVVPISLSEDPEKLAKILNDYEILSSFAGFAIGELTNLVLAHGNLCNIRKSKQLLPKSTIHFYLSLIDSKLPKVLKELARIEGRSKSGKILGQVGSAVEAGEITVDEVINTLKTVKYKKIERSPIVVTFGLNWLETVGIRQFEFSEDSAYAILCNKLENELEDYLRAKTTHSFHYSEASSRTGETLSVRLVFPEINLSEVDTLPLREVEDDMPWWELLEITNFISVYEMSYEEAALLP